MRRYVGQRHRFSLARHGKKFPAASRRRPARCVLCVKRRSSTPCGDGPAAHRPPAAPAPPTSTTRACSSALSTGSSPAPTPPSCPAASLRRRAQACSRHLRAGKSPALRLLRPARPAAPLPAGAAARHAAQVVGCEGQPDVRMRAHGVAVLRAWIDRAAIVEKQHRPHRLARRGRQERVHGETPAQVFGMRGNDQSGGIRRHTVGKSSLTRLFSDLSKAPS